MSGSPRYAVPAARHRVEDVIQRSRFITTVARAPDADTARAFIDGVRAEMPAATHHCWAFVAGPPGSSAAIGMSDAGEPHGTAGRPMLEALLHSGVGEIAAVVTRYYGGTKLGKGGLARAYAGGVTHALEELPRTMRVERTRVRLAIDYADIDSVRRLIAEEDALLVNESYVEEVFYDVAVDAGREEAFRERLASATAARARVVEEGA